MEIFIARQPIFDLKNRLHGYELLYRSSGTVNAAVGATPEEMTAKVVVHSIVDIGMERLTGGAAGYLNCTRKMVVDGFVELLRPDGLVVELLEQIEPDDEVVAACERLREKGYVLALDDFEYEPPFDPLLRLAHIVKLDVLNRTPEQIAAAAEPLRAFEVRLLAERVENSEIHDACVALGFELFQGYHYSRPEILGKRELSTEHVAILRLMNLLRDESVTDGRVEEAFRSDPSLSYKLLRIVNSAAVGGRGIESILHAIRLIGRAPLGRWLALLLVASLGAGGGPNYELAQTAILRARLCELLADASGRPALGGPMFMVGLFSLLDALTGLPMDQVLTGIDLAPGVGDALLRREGPYAAALNLAEAYDAGEWDRVVATAGAFGLPSEQVPELYLESLGWARLRLSEAAE